MNGDASSNSIPSGVQGICPTGWHVPSDTEWTLLTNYVGLNYMCGNDNNHNAKALAATTGWKTVTDACAVGNDLSANNATGFSALPTDSEDFDSFGMRAYFWSTTQRNSANAYNRYLTHYNTTVYSHPVGKSNGYSVRCLRD